MDELCLQGAAETLGYAKTYSVPGHRSFNASGHYILAFYTKCGLPMVAVAVSRNSAKSSISQESQAILVRLHTH